MAEANAVARDERDRQVIESATRLFVERGIVNVTMVDIAEAAGVGVATVYRHFSTKANVAIEAATVLWERFNSTITELVESDRFLQLSGIRRLRLLLDGYCEAYVRQGDFVSFLDEFDHLVVSGRLRREDLGQYGAAIDSFYLVFEDAYQLGRTDGSIVREVAFRPFYLALTHALMGVAQKLRRGEIIPSDDFSSGADELRALVDMALGSLVSEAPIPAPEGLHAGEDR